MKYFIIATIFLVSLGLSVAQLELEAEWIHVGKPAPSEKISMLVGLQQKNVEILEAKALSVSDPDSPEYGKFLSMEEIKALVSPSKKDHDIVFNYFAQKGCKVDTFSDALAVECSIATVERMFNTEFAVYKHEKEDARLVRHMKAYTIPQEILSRIDILTTAEGQCRIFQRKAKKMKERAGQVFQNSNSSASPYGYVHPAFLRKMYGFPDSLFPAVSNLASQAIGELGGVGFPYYFDLQNWANLTNTEYANFTNFPGGTGSLFGAAVESTLDAEYIQAIGQGVPTWYHYAPGWMLDITVALNNISKIPQVFSLSYGWEEFDQCDSQFTGTDCHGWTAAQYIKRTDVEFAKLAARGVSVFVASGDEGAPGELNNQCVSPAGKQLGSLYPESSPWVTTVSATTPIITSGSYDIDMPPLCDQTTYPCLHQHVEEVACLWNNTYYYWTTGGGFSIDTPMPSYQQAAVKKYLSLGPSNLPAPGLFNPKNRAYPDISAAGARFLYLVDNVVTVVEGTSASAPIVAAFVSLINAYRMDQNKPPLGFLNPLIYKLGASNPAIFNDITIGTNRCTVDGYCCPYGYDATKGWDAVTGFGSIRFDKFFEVVKKL